MYEEVIEVSFTDATEAFTHQIEGAQFTGLRYDAENRLFVCKFTRKIEQLEND